MNREIIQGIKFAALEEDWELATQLSIENPIEAKHAALEHWVGTLVYQNEED